MHTPVMSSIGLTEDMPQAPGKKADLKIRERKEMPAGTILLNLKKFRYKYKLILPQHTSVGVNSNSCV